MSSRRSRSLGDAHRKTWESVDRSLPGSAPPAPPPRVAVGRGDDAYVDRAGDARRRWGAPRHSTATHPQDNFRLERQRHLADLVEEERAAVRPARRRPFLSSVAPGEGGPSCRTSSLSSRFSGARRSSARDDLVLCAATGGGSPTRPAPCRCHVSALDEHRHPRVDHLRASRRAAASPLASPMIPSERFCARCLRKLFSLRALASPMLTRIVDPRVGDDQRPLRHQHQQVRVALL